MERLDPLPAAVQIVQERYPECDAALLAGSVVRGEATATSDLDIVVVMPAGSTVFRESFTALGWLVEAFVHTEASLAHFFAHDAARGRPSLPRMCAEGQVVSDRIGAGPRIRATARKLLIRGPAPLDAAELAAKRYAVTDTLDNLRGARGPAEAVLLAARLAEGSVDLVLGARGRWRGDGAWTLRALREADVEAGARLASALDSFARTADTAPLIAFARDMLATVGGPLFDGYRVEARQP